MFLIGACLSSTEGILHHAIFTCYICSNVCLQESSTAYHGDLYCPVLLSEFMTLMKWIRTGTKIRFHDVIISKSAITDLPLGFTKTFQNFQRFRFSINGNLNQFYLVTFSIPAFSFEPACGNLLLVNNSVKMAFFAKNFTI